MHGLLRRRTNVYTLLSVVVRVGFPEDGGDSPGTTFALTREDPERASVKGIFMKKVVAEKRREIDFSRAKRGPVVTPPPGKTKISIRLDNSVVEYFRNMVDKAGGGNYQTLINDALLEHIHRRSTLDAVRQVVREELAPYGPARR